MDQSCSTSDNLVPYERERLERIKRNRGILLELGLLKPEVDQQRSCKAKPISRKQNTTKPAALAEPVRKSRRLQQLEAEPVEVVFDAHGSRPAEIRHAKVKLSENVDPQEYDSLNAYRLSTMSEDALRLRIRRIRNVSKMRSFVKMLQANQLEKLAEEAQQALELLEA